MEERTDWYGERVTATLAPRRVVHKFRCPGCRIHRRTSTRHPSGNCPQCILRGHRYWLKRWDLAEIREVACLIWPEDFLRGDVAA